MSTITTFNPEEYYFTSETHGMAASLPSYHIQHGGSGRFAEFMRWITELFGTRVYGNNIPTMMHKRLHKINHWSTNNYSIDVKDDKLKYQINSWVREQFKIQFKEELSSEMTKRHLPVVAPNEVWVDNKNL